MVITILTVATVGKIQKLHWWLWITLCVKRYKAGFCWGMQQSVIFLPFFYCRRSRTPYNAPPSTRRMWITSHKQPVGWREKILKNGVDSERGKRNIRHLATVSESRVALLFNNLSDNLCGHSKWHGFLMSSDNKWIPSLWVNIRNSLRSLIHEHQT